MPYPLSVRAGVGSGAFAGRNPYGTGPRLAMWVWAYDLKTKADIDSMLAWAEGRMDDLFVFAIDDSNPSACRWLGNGGTMGKTCATVIDGTTPLQYLIREAERKGIRVQAWIWLGYFYYWGTATGVMSPDCPNTPTYNDASQWNFHDATARQLLVDTIADFWQANPGLMGINFNDESTTANITMQDMTDFMTAMRAAIPAVEFSLCATSLPAHINDMKLDPVGWLNSGLIDTVTIMGYYNAIQYTNNFRTLLPALGETHLYGGIGVETNSMTPSDLAHRWIYMQEDNYASIAVFCWGNDLKGDAGFRQVVDDYLADNLVANQAPITKITGTYGVSFALTIGGVVQTTLYSAVTDHLYSGPLKRHIEAAVGSTNPAVLYVRNNSTVTMILFGDFEP